MLRFDGKAVESQDIERQFRAMAYRGLDRRRSRCLQTIGLGHLLTRTTPEDVFDAQPLHDAEAGFTLVADLRLDNRKEIATYLRLDNEKLKLMSDAALLLEAFKYWGENSVDYLVGDFVFAVWDQRARCLTLASDHMGQRSIFYHQSNDFLVFASDIKGLWALPEVPRALSDEQIGILLMRGSNPTLGNTLYEGINRLPGSTVMSVNSHGQTSKNTYWAPQANEQHEGRDETYYIEAYRHVLGEAVACRLRTSRAPGLIFSGGFDSTAVAALAGSPLKEQGRKLVAVASTMPEDYRGTIRHARPWVEMCRRDMPHLDVHYVTREGISALTTLESRYLATGTFAGNYQFVREALYRRLGELGARVVMDGHGGDYTLNPRGQAALARFLKHGRLLRFGKEFRGHLRHSGHTIGETLRRDLGSLLLPEALLSLWRRFRHGDRPSWKVEPIQPAFAAQLISQGVVDPHSREGGRSSIEMRKQLEANLGRVRNVGGGGSEAAAFGLELTRPFHDKRVVELALAIPEDLYVKNGLNRYLARKALQDLYPPEFQTRGRKNDDQVPDFLRMVKSIEPQLLSEIARMESFEGLARYVDFKKVRRLLEAREVENHNSGWEPETQKALRGILLARYIEWFRGLNG